MEQGQVDVSAWPTELSGPPKMSERFPLWVRPEAGIVKAVIDWAAPGAVDVLRLWV